MRQELDAERVETQRQLAQGRRDEAKFLRELKLSRRAFQSDAMNATFGNATVVGAAIPQNVDEFGTEAGIDLTQVGAQSSGTQTSPSKEPQRQSCKAAAPPKPPRTQSYRTWTRSLPP